MLHLFCRLEWESAVIRGNHCFQALEEERLQQLKELASCYLNNYKEIGPKLVQVSLTFNHFIACVVDLFLCLHWNGSFLK